MKHKFPGHGWAYAGILLLVQLYVIGTICSLHFRNSTGYYATYNALYISGMFLVGFYYESFKDFEYIKDKKMWFAVTKCRHKLCRTNSIPSAAS